MEDEGSYSDEESRSSDESLTKKDYLNAYDFRHSNRSSEVEEEESSELFEIKLDVAVRSTSINREEDDYEGSWFSFDFRKFEDCVYVAVGDNVGSAMDALQWTLNHAVSPFSVVYLLHVFPEMRFIPSPLGMLPREQVNPGVVMKHMAEERAKRMKFLQKFVDTCSAVQVKGEALMIQSDTVAKAILHLISVFHIRKLIFGSTKPRKWRPKRKRGIALEIMQNAEEFCDVKIICKGKETTDQMSDSSSSSSSHSLSPNLSDKNGDFINMKTMQTWVLNTLGFHRT